LASYKKNKIFLALKSKKTYFFIRKKNEIFGSLKVGWLDEVGVIADPLPHHQGVRRYPLRDTFVSGDADEPVMLFFR